MALGALIDVAFAQKLARFIGYNSVTGIANKVDAKALAKKCGVLMEDLEKWSAGTASPSQMKKREINDFLDTEAKK